VDNITRFHGPACSTNLGTLYSSLALTYSSVEYSEQTDTPHSNLIWKGMPLVHGKENNFRRSFLGRLISIIILLLYSSWSLPSLRSSDHAFFLVLDSFETGKAHPSPQAAAETSIVLDPHPYPHPKTNSRMYGLSYEELNLIVLTTRIVVIWV
jgi:hypothetical protein